MDRELSPAGLARSALLTPGDADPLPIADRVGGMATPSQHLSPRCMLAGADQRCALLHQVAIGGSTAVPFEHREFRVVCRAPLAVAEDMSELPDPKASRRRAASSSANSGEVWR